MKKLQLREGLTAVEDICRWAYEWNARVILQGIDDNGQEFKVTLKWPELKKLYEWAYNKLYRWQVYLRVGTLG